MAKSTPYFTGARLREGREARGLTVTTLADLLGVAKQSVSFYENGHQIPRFDMVEKMSAVLNLPLQFFIGESTEAESALFRSRKSAADISRLRAKRKLSWLVNAVQYLKTSLDFPKVNVPHLAQDVNPLSLSIQQIEDSAYQVRELWGLGDKIIGNLTALLEANGVIIGCIDLSDDLLQGLSRWYDKDNSPYVLLNSEMGTPSRKRLTLAYELGRLVLHRYVILDEHTPKDQKLLEQQAYLFGSSFLMPASTFRLNFYTPSLDVFQTRKLQWKVSIAAMIHRSQDMGLLDKERAKSLWIGYARRGWKQREPFEEQVPFEEPNLLKAGMSQLLDGSYLSVEDFLSNIPYGSHDIEELCSLPKYSFHHRAMQAIAPKLRAAGQEVTVEYLGQTTLLKLGQRKEDILSDTAQTKGASG
jgi:Zn-dependent peptidase ImmA (M78 family)/DNA-binding XRE family transcriptional regulator